MKDMRPLTKELKKEVRLTLYPLLEQASFVRRKGAPEQEFWRLTQCGEQFLTIHWEKYQLPRFILIFGYTEPIHKEGRVHTLEKATLCPRWSIGTGGWFRADQPFLNRIFLSKTNDADAIAQTIQKLVKAWPEVLAWLDRKEKGPHVFITREVLRFKEGYEPQ
jgi:hypothetical protein